MSRIPEAEAEAVHERAGGYCEACAYPLGGWPLPELHHRHARGMGGSGNHFPWIDLAVNLMLVHSACHNGARWSIHGRGDRSERLGHIVRYGTDPATVTVYTAQNLRELVA